MTTKRSSGDVEVNFYIAFADLAFTLVLVMVMVMIVITLYGRIGWDDIKYRDAQAKVAHAVKVAYRGTKAPTTNEDKNDPPGAQRWVFSQANLFEKGTAHLTPAGRSILLRFASIVRVNQALWRRLRIEGHTMPTRTGQQDNWLLSTQRAEQVARVFYGAGHIPTHRMAIAGRAGQNPLFTRDRSNPANERVEFLIEYAQKAQ